MSDDNKPTLGRKPLGLKLSVQAGQVQQTFSHGRTNKVVVEVKRRKLIGKPGEAPVAAPPPPPPAPVAQAPRAPAPKPAASSGETRQEQQTRLLREAEEARMNANELASRREQDERQAAQGEERRRTEENTQADSAPAAAPEPEAAPPKAGIEAEAGAEAPAADTDDAAPRGAAAPVARRFTPIAAPKRPEPAKKAAHPRDKTPEQRRHAGKLTVSRALNEDEGARARSLAALKRAREKEKRAHFAGQSQPREKQARDVIVPE